MHKEMSVTPDESRKADSRPLPPDDLALFSTLLPHEVPGVADSRIQAYRDMIETMNGYIIQLLAIRNAAIPLHATLPPEILMNVFRHVLPTCPSDIRLTHVCNLWRDLIHRTPEFWVDMLATSAVSSCLANCNSDSSVSLLSFIVRSSPLPYNLDVRAELAFLTKIPDHTSRIYSLSWHIPREANEEDYRTYFTSFFDLNLPLLEEMRCSSDRHNTSWPGINDHTIPSHREKFPRLRKLTLYGMGLACRVFAFSTLKELDIDDGVYPVTVGSAALLGLLERCPQLQVVALWMNAPAEQLFPGPHDVISLPNLTKLSITLRAPAPAWAHEFLDRVNVPRTAHLDIAWLAGSGTSLSRLIPASPPASNIEAIRTIDTLTIRLRFGPKHPWLLRAKCFVPGDSKAHLALYIHDPCWSATEGTVILLSNALSDLVRLFSDAPALTDLKLRVDPGLGVTPVDWFNILNALPSLSSLAVHLDSCRNLLAVLRRNPARWPALRRLSILCRNGPGVHESLLCAVERRAHEDLRLDYLAFSGDRNKALSEHRMCRLQRLVGEVTTTVDELEL
ncbi:hypothetical protein C8T65DRAFT_21290 [Cerioporus squamosus]|nr:hypothetical protein C8T65DRAFT_21290 [Cerioporus squamosus]